MALPNIITANMVLNTRGAIAAAGAAGTAASAAFSKGFAGGSGGGLPLGRLTGDFSKFQQSIDAATARVLAFTATTGLLYGMGNAIKRLATDAIKIEAIMARIGSVTGNTGDELKAFQKEIFILANKTSTSFEQAAEAAEEFSRQGLALNQTLDATRAALAIAKLSGTSAKSAIEGLTASISTFGDKAGTYTEVAGKLLALDAKFATSAGGIIQGLTRVAGVAEQAGLSLDETASAITALKQVTGRSEAVLGNSLKSIFTSLQNEKVIKQLRGIGVEVEASSGEFKDMIPVIRELSIAFDGLNDAQRSAITQKVAGKYQANAFEGLLKAFRSGGEFDKALATSSGSEGQLEKRLAAIFGTTEAGLQRLSNRITEFGGQIGGKFTKPLVDSFSTAFTGVLDTVASQFEKDGKGMGDLFIAGLVNVITGPGVLLVGAALAKLLGKFTLEASQALASVAGIGKAKQRNYEIDQFALKVVNSLSAAEQARIAGLSTVLQRQQAITEQMNLQIQRSKALVATNILGFDARAINPIAANRLQRGIRSIDNKASGDLPERQAIIREAIDIKNGVGGARPHARPKVEYLNLGKGREKVVVNTDEKIVRNYGGGRQDAVLNREMMGYSWGAIPNFAIGRSRATSTPIGEGSFGEFNVYSRRPHLGYKIFHAERYRDKDISSEFQRFGLLNKYKNSGSLPGYIDNVQLLGNEQRANARNRLGKTVAPGTVAAKSKVAVIGGILGDMLRLNYKKAGLHVEDLRPYNFSINPVAEQALSSISRRYGKLRSANRETNSTKRRVRALAERKLEKTPGAKLFVFDPGETEAMFKGAAKSMSGGYIPNMAPGIFNANRHIKSGGTLSRGNKASAVGMQYILKDAGIQGSFTTQDELIKLLSSKSNKLQLYRYLQKNPISIASFPGNHKEISDGNHRFALAGYAGIKSIPSNSGGHVPNFASGILGKTVPNLARSNTDLRKLGFSITRGSQRPFSTISQRLDEGVRKKTLELKAFLKESERLRSIPKYSISPQFNLPKSAQDGVNKARSEIFAKSFVSKKFQNTVTNLERLARETRGAGAYGSPATNPQVKVEEGNRKRQKLIAEQRAARDRIRDIRDKLPLGPRVSQPSNKNTFSSGGLLLPNQPSVSIGTQSSTLYGPRETSASRAIRQARTYVDTAGKLGYQRAISRNNLGFRQFSQRATTASFIDSQQKLLRSRQYQIPASTSSSSATSTTLQSIKRQGGRTGFAVVPSTTSSPIGGGGHTFNIGAGRGVTQATLNPLNTTGQVSTARTPFVASGAITVNGRGGRVGGGNFQVAGGGFSGPAPVTAPATGPKPITSSVSGIRQKIDYKRLAAIDRQIINNQGKISRADRAFVNRVGVDKFSDGAKAALQNRDNVVSSRYAKVSGAGFAASFIGGSIAQNYTGPNGEQTSTSKKISDISSSVGIGALVAGFGGIGAPIGIAVAALGTLDAALKEGPDRINGYKKELATLGEKFKNDQTAMQSYIENFDGLSAAMATGSKQAVEAASSLLALSLGGITDQDRKKRFLSAKTQDERIQIANESAAENKRIESGKAFRIQAEEFAKKQNDGGFVDGARNFLLDNAADIASSILPGGGALVDLGGFREKIALKRRFENDIPDDVRSSLAQGVLGEIDTKKLTDQQREIFKNYNSSEVGELEKLFSTDVLKGLEPLRKSANFGQLLTEIGIALEERLKNERLAAQAAEQQAAQSKSNFNYKSQLNRQIGDTGLKAFSRNLQSNTGIELLEAQLDSLKGTLTETATATAAYQLQTAKLNLNLRAAKDDSVGNILRGANELVGDTLDEEDRKKFTAAIEGFKQTENVGAFISGLKGISSIQPSDLTKFEDQAIEIVNELKKNTEQSVEAAKKTSVDFKNLIETIKQGQRSNLYGGGNITQPLDEVLKVVKAGLSASFTKNINKFQDPKRPGVGITFVRGGAEQRPSTSSLAQESARIRELEATRGRTGIAGLEASKGAGILGIDLDENSPKVLRDLQKKVKDQRRAEFAGFAEKALLDNQKDSLFNEFDTTIGSISAEQKKILGYSPVDNINTKKSVRDSLELGDYKSAISTLEGAKADSTIPEVTEKFQKLIDSIKLNEEFAKSIPLAAKEAAERFEPKDVADPFKKALGELEKSSDASRAFLSSIDSVLKAGQAKAGIESSNTKIAGLTEQQNAIGGKIDAAKVLQQQLIKRQGGSGLSFEGGLGALREQAGRVPYLIKAREDLVSQMRQVAPDEASVAAYDMVYQRAKQSAAAITSRPIENFNLMSPREQEEATRARQSESDETYKKVVELNNNHPKYKRMDLDAEEKKLAKLKELLPYASRVTELNVGENLPTELAAIKNKIAGETLTRGGYEKDLAQAYYKDPVKAVNVDRLVSPGKGVLALPPEAKPAKQRFYDPEFEMAAQASRLEARDALKASKDAAEEQKLRGSASEVTANVNLAFGGFAEVFQTPEIINAISAIIMPGVSKIIEEAFVAAGQGRPKITPK